MSALAWAVWLGCMIVGLVLERTPYERAAGPLFGVALGIAISRVLL